MRVALPALLLALAGPVPALAADVPLPDPAEEAQAQTLMKELRCLVCQGQSIADSDADMAADMRALVRERIEDGQDPEAVRSYLVSRYGDWVTFSPPKRGLNLFLWLAPLVFLLIGGIAAIRLFRKRPDA
ncbi:cytochrome c-type biogenesis protein [Pacificimonas flava]|uniref:Cytochrome c-type biogenesis protein n=1 Tax=Pacificimonas flava TaxID=1234595 RepID=M2SAU6_9SPHN|nr:cytochrome c-type biogenesis protein [Pacificimonas flava]EMD82510.1 Cytochrome c heme lyase subunit CcmL [Pacificimonas flava]